MKLQAQKKRWDITQPGFINIVINIYLNDSMLSSLANIPYFLLRLVGKHSLLLKVSDM